MEYLHTFMLDLKLTLEWWEKWRHSATNCRTDFPSLEGQNFRQSQSRYFLYLFAEGDAILTVQDRTVDV